MDKHNSKPVSEKELDGLLNEAFLDLDFEDRENRKLLECVADKTLHKTSFGFNRKTLFDSFFLLFSALVFLYSLLDYLRAADPSEVLKLSSQEPVLSAPKTSDIRIDSGIQPVKLQAFTLPKLIKEKPETKPLPVVKSKEPAGSVHRVKENEEPESTAEVNNPPTEALALAKDTLSSTTAQQPARTKKTVSKQRAVRNRDQEVANVPVPVKLNSRKKYLTKLRTWFRRKKRKDHWGGEYNRAGYRKK